MRLSDDYETTLPAQTSEDTFSTKHLKRDLKARSVRGAFLTLVSQGSQFILFSTATVVMARLLAPADYGLVAMVTAITTVGQAFADLGLSEATIQRENLRHDQVSTLFWINVAIGLILTLVTAALAPVLAWFYREPRLLWIALVFSPTFLIGGLRVQHDALLQRQMRFFLLAIRDVSSWAVAVPVAITLAWRGAGYWALIALPLTFNLTQMVLSWVMARWIPGLPRRNADVRSLISFGGKVAVCYLIWNPMRTADNVLIGWHWGAGPLGLYSKACNLLMMPVRQITSPARSVAIPTFSRTQGEPERFARYYLRAMNLMIWIGMPLFGFLLVAAEPVIIVTLGNQWKQAASVFQILAIGAVGQLLLETSVWLLVSRGQSGRLLKLFLIICPIIVGGFAIGLPFGIKGVALSGSLVFLALLPWMLNFAFQGTSLTLPRLGQAILWPILVGLAGIAFAEGALRVMVPRHVLSQLLAAALGFAVAYSLSLLIPPVRREIVSFKELLGPLRLSKRTA